jgi:AcrR family transcriptional regulator
MKTSRRQRNKDDKQRRLLASARRLFKQQGVEATTIRQIAADADVGLGTVYSYVRDKNHLLDLISKDDMARVAQRIFADEPRAADVLTRLRFVFGRIFAHHGRDLATARVIFRELGFGGDPEAAERAARTFGLVTAIAAIYADGQRRGELGTHFTALEAATTAFGLHYFFLILWMSGAAGLDQKSALAQLERALSLQLTGLVAHKGARQK